MKIFKLVQKKFLLVYKIGLHQRPINCKTLLALFIFCIGIVLNCVYFFNEAKTFQDYANSVLFGTGLFAAAIIFTYVSFSMRQIFGCLYDAEKIINGSKFFQQNYNNCYKHIRGLGFSFVSFF